MKLYIIRHGESQTNRDKLWTGWLDVPLTELGEEQAKAVRPVIKNLKFDKIYSSDLTRAKKTAEIAIPGCTYETTPLLREVALGRLEGTPLGGLSDDSKLSVSKNGYKEFGGESYDEIMGRAKEFFDTVAKLDCECVAAFSHAGFLRTAVDLTLGMKIPRSKVVCNNCAVCVFEYSGGTWKLYSLINN